jgi:hypothetical protein
MASNNSIQSKFGTPKFLSVRDSFNSSGGKLKFNGNRSGNIMFDAPRHHYYGSKEFKSVHHEITEESGITDMPGRDHASVALELSKLKPDTPSESSMESKGCGLLEEESVGTFRQGFDDSKENLFK